MWLSANPKVYRFLLPYLQYTKRYGQLERGGAKQKVTDFIGKNII